MNNSETKKDPVGILGMEAFQTVAIQGKGDAEAREEQSRNNTIALRQGLGSTSSDTHNNIFELFIKLKKVKVKSLSCVRLFVTPVDCSPPGSSVHGILQARILEWVAISFSRGSSQSRDRTQVSHIGGRCFNL